MSLDRALTALLCLGAILPLFHLSQGATSLPAITSTSALNCSATLLQPQASPTPNFLGSLSSQLGMGQVQPKQSCAAQSRHIPGLNLSAAYTSLGGWLD